MIGWRCEGEIFLRGLAGRRPAVPVDPVRLEARARRSMSREALARGCPYAYGLVIAGETDLREVIRTVLAELDITLGLAGRASVRELTDEVLVRTDDA
jgi:lactate 2-monooxygenase